VADVVSHSDPLADTRYTDHLAGAEREEPAVTEASNWRDVKAKARAAHPTWDGAGRVARRQQMREQMLASVSGAQRASGKGLTTEFHAWGDIRAELDDGDSDAPTAERAPTRSVSQRPSA
jgi:hypothetical protein